MFHKNLINLPQKSKLDLESTLLLSSSKKTTVSKTSHFGDSVYASLTSHPLFMWRSEQRQTL